MKKILPPIVFLVLLAVGSLLMVKPNIVSSWGGAVAPTRAVIVRETGESKPLSLELTEVYAKAPSLGVSVWDKDVTGKGKKPSPEAKPFLDAAGTDGLPKMVFLWPGGSMTVKPCPTTLGALKKEIGK